MQVNTFPKNAYGLLMTFDGYGAPDTVTGDVAYLKTVLETLPETIGMRRLGEPNIISVDEIGIAGLSGFTFIIESHISIHTYIERGFVTADIYSCKWFDTDVVTKFLSEAFKTQSFEVNQVIRGKHFNSPV